MEPYLLTTLAMCLVLLVALAGTAYLAVFFNRRAKADLEAALTPLADSVAGTVDVEEAEVTGTFDDYPVYARMANASEGPGRVFQSDVVDAAGGEPWQYTSNPPTKSETSRVVDFDGASSVQAVVDPLIDRDARAFLDPDQERFRVEYLPDKGFVRLVRAMRTRRDIPDVDMFTTQLRLLANVADANRQYQELHAAETSTATRQVES